MNIEKGVIHLKIVMNREKAMHHEIVKPYVISNEKAKIIYQKGLIDYYVFDDQAKKDPVTVRYKRKNRGGKPYGKQNHKA